MNDLVVKEVDFNGNQLVAIQENTTKEIYVAINYVLRGLGFDEDFIRRQRDKWSTDRVISKGVTKFMSPSAGGTQEMQCINIKKLPLALAKINITPTMQQDRPELAALLESYQDECADILAEAFLPQLAKRKKPVNIVFRQRFDMSKVLIEYLGVKPGIAYALAIAETEKETGITLDQYKQLLPVAEHKTGTLNATAVGKLIGKDARGVNTLLEKLGLQYRDEKKRWRLTDNGKNYAEEMPFVRNGHSDYQIRWNGNIEEMLIVAN